MLSKVRSYLVFPYTYMLFNITGILRFTFLFFYSSFAISCVCFPLSLPTPLEMAEVYTKGLKPIAQDGTEALKCYEKGINKVKGLISKARLNESTYLNRTLDVYRRIACYICLSMSNTLSTLCPLNALYFSLCLQLYLSQRWQRCIRMVFLQFLQIQSRHRNILRKQACIGHLTEQDLV